MQTKDLKALIEVVNAVRAELHPDLDAAFLEAVIRAEDKYLDDPVEASRAVQDALKALLAKKGGA
jgi:hypothetical protein